MDRVRIVTRGGRKILHTDLSNCKAIEVVGLLAHTRDLARKEHRGSLLSLTNVTHMQFNQDAAEALKETAKRNKDFVRAAAVVGVKGLQNIILDAVSSTTDRSFAVFESVDAAEQWLLQR